MIDKIFSSMDEAVADISDGSTIMFPGFGNTGIPRNLMAALLTQGAKNLIGISNGSGGRDDRIDIGVLVRARQFKKLVMAFTASPHPSRATIFNELYEAKEIEAELVTQGTMAERIRAAGAGIGAFYTPASVGTELAEGKEHRTIDGKEYVLEYPFHADYAFIRATRADTLGQPPVHAGATQLQPHHGDGCQDNHCRSRRGHSGGRSHRPGSRSHGWNIC